MFKQMLAAASVNYNDKGRRFAAPFSIRHRESDPRFAPGP
jgi:hypothetical protein